jgi:hypothetical protein
MRAQQLVDKFLQADELLDVDEGLIANYNKVALLVDHSGNSALESTHSLPAQTRMEGDKTITEETTVYHKKGEGDFNTNTSYALTRRTESFQNPETGKTESKTTSSWVRIPSRVDLEKDIGSSIDGMMDGSVTTSSDKALMLRNMQKTLMKTQNQLREGLTPTPTKPRGHQGDFKESDYPAEKNRSIGNIFERVKGSCGGTTFNGVVQTGVTLEELKSKLQESVSQMCDLDHSIEGQRKGKDLTRDLLFGACIDGYSDIESPVETFLKTSSICTRACDSTVIHRWSLASATIDRNNPENSTTSIDTRTPNTIEVKQRQFLHFTVQKPDSGSAEPEPIVPEEDLFVVTYKSVLSRNPETGAITKNFSVAWERVPPPPIPSTKE